MDPRDLEERIRYAVNWARDFKVVEREPVELDERERDALRELVESMAELETGEDIQGAVFTVARKHSIKPRDFFRTLYKILLGTQEGPRFGPYVATVGKDRVLKLLREVLNDQ